MKKKVAVMGLVAILTFSVGAVMLANRNEEVTDWAQDERMAEAERRVEEMRKFAVEYEFVGWRVNTSADESEYTITISDS